jgi:hypothetical protein
MTLIGCGGGDESGKQGAATGGAGGMAGSGGTVQQVGGAVTGGQATAGQPSTGGSAGQAAAGGGTGGATGGSGGASGGGGTGGASTGANGGASTGGAATGGTATGGTSVGGAPAGGAATGGVTTGGIASGGVATGGTTTGGTDTGGAATGGVANGTGGAATGGVANGTGGATTGGTSSGGTSVGGSSTGGAATGGVTTGGIASGGVSAGGAATGGAATGGMATGGTPTGGTPAGGAATGGVTTGGIASGGVATGGAATGGVATGGVATGGVVTGGTATGGTNSGGSSLGGAGGAGGAGGGSAYNNYSVSCDSVDHDGDGFSACQGDCNDADGGVIPLVVDANVALAGNGTPANPYKTIAQAVAGFGTRTCRSIVLKPGTYTDANIASTSYSIASTDGPTVTFWEPPAGQWAINYQGTGALTVRGITFRSGSTASRGISFAHSGSNYCGNLTVEASVFQGLDRAVYINTCAGGSIMLIQGNVFRANTYSQIDTTYDVGGAITDFGYAGPALTFNILNNVFDSNTSQGGGAAIAIYHTIGLIQGNRFLNNVAHRYGGAIYGTASVGSSADFRIRQNWFGGNKTDASGAGAYLAVSGVSTYIENNVFDANIAAGDGGGLNLSGPSGKMRRLINNTFVDNQAGRGGHVYIRSWAGDALANIFDISWAGGGLSADTWSAPADAPVFTYNDAYQGNPDYTGALTSLTITGQNGNVSVDPGFVGHVVDQNPTNDDLHLKPASPLVDAGPCVPPTVLDVDGTCNDPGAYGGPGGNW